MGLFNSSQLDQINKVAAKSKAALQPVKPVKASSISAELQEMSSKVEAYFPDSPAILINNVYELHDYIDEVISAGTAGIDTETTGLDRIHDTIVGSSLYYPGGVECYIPNKHKIPVFDEPYKDQLTYEECKREFQRLVDHKVKLVYANADFDLAMIAKDYEVDLSSVAYYDVILAWRCIKENELHNGLKELYNKYVLKGEGDPKKFTDFFSTALFPYCKPQVAKLYAANDARITYELMQWQLPYITPDHPKCKKHHLESIASLVWNVEFPMMRVCFNLHRRGIYLDNEIARRLSTRYNMQLTAESDNLSHMVDDLIADVDYATMIKCPFKRGSAFNPNSSVHVKYLCKNILKLNVGDSLDKETLKDLNLPVTKQIIKVRNLIKLLGTYVDKLPKSTGADSHIHARFNSIGADTGRMSSADPNLQNIPSHAVDIRHMFRAQAATTAMLDCTYQDQSDMICITTSKFNKVTTPNGDVSIHDLNIGDSVKLLDNGKEVWRCVKSISTPCEDSGVCDVVF